MRHFAGDKDNIIRRVPEDRRNKLGLLDVEVMRTVRGNIRTGTAPYVDFGCARYRSDVLARMPELIGTKLRLIIDSEDARSLDAYLPGGAQFGKLTAGGFWGVRPHTVEQRIAIQSLKRDRLIYLTSTQDPFPVYFKYLAQKKDKTSVRALAKAQKQEAETPEPSEPPNAASGRSQPALTDTDDDLQPEKPLTRRTFNL